MGITTDFNVFANNYHQQNGTTRPDIMSLLPHDLIMRIIKEADGGLNAHKSKFKKALVVFEGEGSIQDHYNDLDKLQFWSAEHGWEPTSYSEVWNDVWINEITFDIHAGTQRGQVLEIDDDDY